MPGALVGGWLVWAAVSFAPPEGLALPISGPGVDRGTENRSPVLAFSPLAANAPKTAERPPSVEERARALDLVPLPGGGWVYVGRGSERFSATIRADGTVELDADEGFQVEIDKVCVAVLCVDPRPKPLRGKTAKDRARWLAAQAPTYPSNGAAMAIAGTRGVNPWNPPSGDPAHDHSQLTPPAYPYASIGGRYGWLPYPAHAVAGFLDRTFEFRLDLVRTALRERLAQQAARLPQDLLDAWRGRGSNPSRRGAVLDMWAELEPPHVDPEIDAALRSDVDRQRSQAADRARGVILEFVHQYAPAGSPEAFSDEELLRFNAARDEAEQFWPYGR